MPDTTTVTDDAPDLGIEVWYQNPETGGTFGFGLPLPPSIPPQIAAGRLRECAGPDGGWVAPDSAAAVSEADGDGAADPEQEAVLYPCQDCGKVAAKDTDGFYTDHCEKHTPKPTGARRSGK